MHITADHFHNNPVNNHRINLQENYLPSFYFISILNRRLYGQTAFFTTPDR